LDSNPRTTLANAIFYFGSVFVTLFETGFFLPANQIFCHQLLVYKKEKKEKAHRLANENNNEIFK
jgi:hypothetical protein